MKGIPVTKEIVATAKRYLNDSRYEDMSNHEIALLSGTSATTVSRIKSGQYDYLFEERKEAKEEAKHESTNYSTVIPYEEMEYLIACKSVVKSLFDNAVLSVKYDEGIFIPSGHVVRILKSHFPDKVNEILSTLREEETKESWQVYTQ